MRWDAEPFTGGDRKIGFCALKKVEVIEDTGFTLTVTPEACKDWIKGKPKNK